MLQTPFHCVSIVDVHVIPFVCLRVKVGDSGILASGLSPKRHSSLLEASCRPGSISGSTWTFRAICLGVGLGFISMCICSLKSMKHKDGFEQELGHGFLSNCDSIVE